MIERRRRFLRSDFLLDIATLLPENHCSICAHVLKKQLNHRKLLPAGNSTLVANERVVADLYSEVRKAMTRTAPKNPKLRACYLILNSTVLVSSPFCKFAG